MSYLYTLFIVVIQYHDKKRVFHIVPHSTYVGARVWLGSEETLLQEKNSTGHKWYSNPGPCCIVTEVGLETMISSYLIHIYLNSIRIVSSCLNHMTCIYFILCYQGRYRAGCICIGRQWAGRVLISFLC